MMNNNELYLAIIIIMKNDFFRIFIRTKKLEKKNFEFNNV